MDDSKGIIEAWNNEVGCPICMNEELTNMVETKCNHKFCYDCLEEWLSIDNSCPLCRMRSPKKVPTKLSDFKSKRLLGTLSDFSVNNWKTNILMRMFRNKSCILKINGENITIKSQYKTTLLKTKIRKIRHIRQVENKITLTYVSKVNTNKYRICSGKNNVEKDNDLTFSMDNSSLAKELRDIVVEWFDAGNRYKMEVEYQRRMRMRERSISISSNSSYMSYDDF